MKSRRMAAWLLLLTVFLPAVLAGCGAKQTGETGGETAQVSSSAEPTPEPTPVPTPTPNLVEYTGTVEHIFFHPLVADPSLAFDGDNMSDGFDDWFVTVGEYKKILQSVYDKGFVLVDINSVFSETTAADGTKRMQKNKLMLPEGKKPLIISYDDVNYYDYMRENGVVWKLVLNDQGEIASLSYDKDGKEIISQDNDIITILNSFVKEHPDFSFNGAKACIGLTGFEGILGYRTQADSPNRQSEIEAVKPIVAKLKEEGYTFASHSWGHINMTGASLTRIKADTQKWLDEVEPLIGSTQILIYPFGARVDEKNSPEFQYLQSCGFRVFCSVGVESYVKVRTDTDAVCLDRRHPDGTTLRHGRKRYLDLYDAKDILDLSVRPDRPYDFSLN